ncbi:hypothetical protein HBI52_167100 [Parastagonospora nodorum]|nr:hypothetical protein HBI10_172550 [Parastagonospora nodorum]KAH4016163.1 hypothetical protein HBI13_154210 [Parastagonospora nodorum]KAH4805721.1 hypothetical protein HBH61_155970 [Parastagonospora nodorum]KAH5186309.1 hypothetical protein HBH68_166530 [Parastagonospora nodorum]KAH5351114.1 hypothetical protein HBI48_162300 [Parastagonospora nodorum]
MYTAPRFPPRKFYVWFPLLFLSFPFTLWYYQTLNAIPILYQKTHAHPPAQFTTYGHSDCPLEVSPQLIEESTIKRSICRKYSPFEIRRWRIATVTAQFGQPKEHYQKAFRTHLLHALIHSTDVKVVCDPIVDDLWNKPAFILQILMQEMLKPEHERLEWIEWLDRDTLILDQCRPIASFLPSPAPRRKHRENYQEQPLKPETHLLVTRDWNGLNNGIFLVRVNEWAVKLFAAILAFRHYKPDVDLRFGEQSAMDHVLGTEEFRNNTQYVPQHWFNGYERERADVFEVRESVVGMKEHEVRRGDYLVHFAGRRYRDMVMNEWADMVGRMGDIWMEKRVLRNVDAEIEKFWAEVQRGPG